MLYDDKGRKVDESKLPHGRDRREAVLAPLRERLEYLRTGHGKLFNLGERARLKGQA